MKQRIISIAAALALCLSLCPAPALAAETPTRTEALDLRSFTEPGTVQENTVEGWRWEITSTTSGTLTLTDCYIRSTSSDVVLLPIMYDDQGDTLDFTTTIVLNGHNMLETSSTSWKPMFYSKAEDGKTDDSSVHYIIQGSGDLNIKAGGMAYAFGAGSITINTGTITSNICFCTILGPFIINAGSLSVSGVDDGLYLVQGPVNIAGGSVDINVSGNGIVTLRNENATTISGGVVNVTSGKASIGSGGGVSISGGAVVLNKAPNPSSEQQNCLLLVGDEGRVYGDAVLTQDLTIPEGATVTIPQDASLSIASGAVLTNNGTVRLEDDGITDIPAYIQDLNLAGSGTVMVEKQAEGGGTVEETYTNEGKRLLPSAGALDLSNAEATEANWTTQGYKWEVTKGEDGSGNTIITSAKLTLAAGFNATTVTLPDTAVTIETTGESSIGTLTFQNDSSKFVDLIFDGAGPLTVQEQINIASGDHNTLTVNKDANVIANGGIYIGASGGVNSIVTINGNLTATAGSGTVISTGSVAIGETGILKVSGEYGVVLNGMPKNTDAIFNNVFTIADGGCFTANCSTCNLRASTTNSTEFPANAGDAFVIPKDFLPEGCEPKLNGKNIDLWNTKINDVYSGALTIHKYHTWSSAWTADGDNGHYHACTFEGCTAKNDERPHFYAHGADACRDCGYARPAGTPDSDSGSSGGSGSETTYTVTVEKAEHGKVASNRRTASRGDTVTLTATADSGYALDTLTVTDSRGNDVVVTEKDNGKYTFTMPNRAVTVRAAFISSACTGGADCPSRAFSDLDTGKWYHEAVDYVLRNNLMDGYGGGLFGPDANLTRAQFTQILYNKEDRPVVNYLLRYNDVADGAWYTEAIRWATSQGVVSGYGNGMFGPNDSITREQLAVMLWRYAGSPAAADKELRFTDADKASGYALDALRWAVENGIINGNGSGQLAPQGLATRAQAAQMLKSYLVH